MLAIPINVTIVTVVSSNEQAVNYFRSNNIIMYLIRCSRLIASSHVVMLEVRLYHYNIITCCEFARIDKNRISRAGVFANNKVRLLCARADRPLSKFRRENDSREVVGNTRRYGFTRRNWKTRRKTGKRKTCRNVAKSIARFTWCVGYRARARACACACVRARSGCACGGPPGSTNSRRNARVYHAATNDDSVRGRFRRRPNVATRSSNPANATKAALCRGALERSLDRSSAAHRSFGRSGRGVRVRRPRRHDNKRDGGKKNAALVAIARETHRSPLHSSPARRHRGSDEINIENIARARSAVRYKPTIIII